MARGTVAPDTRMPIDLARRMAQDALLSDEELSAVVARRASSGEPVPVALQALGFASAEAVSGMFERLGFMEVRRIKPAAFAQSLPKGLMRSLWAIPIGESAAGVIVAMADPTDAHAVAELAFHLRRVIDPRSAPAEKLRTLLADIDPMPRRVNTRPAPGPPPPDAGFEDPRVPARPSAAAVADNVMALASRPPSRRNTPAYGEPSPAPARKSLPKMPAVSRNETPPARRITRKTPLVGASAVPTPRTPSAPPRASGRPSGRPSGPPARESAAPIPLKRKPAAGSRRTPPPSVAHEALHTLSELRTAPDRDTVGRVAATGMLAVAERSAFFVVKRGVVQGWEGVTADGLHAAGFSRGALRNLWIPVTSNGIFRTVNEGGSVHVGKLTDSTADSILGAALGGKPTTVLVGPIEVRGKVVAFLYADGLYDVREAQSRANEIVGGAASALERLAGKA